MKNCENVGNSFKIGDMITPKLANTMLMRTDEREFIQLHHKEWCIVLEVGEKKLLVLYEGLQWWVSNLAMIVISSHISE